jgi:hypothetical protein
MERTLMDNTQGNCFAGMLMVDVSRTPVDSCISLQQKIIDIPSKPPHAIIKIVVLRFKTLAVTFWSALAPL